MGSARTHNTARVCRAIRIFGSGQRAARRRGGWSFRRSRSIERRNDLVLCSVRAHLGEGVRFTAWESQLERRGGDLASLGDIRAALRARWALRATELEGPRVRVWGNPRVVVEGRMLIGDRVRLVSKPACLELFVGRGATLSIGRSSFINHGTSIAALERVEIGESATIGPHCMILDNDFHRLEPSRRQELPPSRPVVLEKNVWLGARVIVLAGVTIGENTVVAAGSVVSRNLPPNVLAGGMPARVIRSLPQP